MSLPPVSPAGFKHMPSPITLEGHGVRLESMTAAHADGLLAAVRDGDLWNLRVTSAPEPKDVAAYIEAALQGQREGHMLPFVVIDTHRNQIVGTSRYHDIVPSVSRLEIGYTWYAKSSQRTHVNTASKLLLLTHAFDTLQASVVGWRTDNYNLASQRAIARLGAKLDGVIRHHALRRDGTVRDTYMYSMTAFEWPNVQRHLFDQLKRHAD